MIPPSNKISLLILFPIFLIITAIIIQSCRRSHELAKEEKHAFTVTEAKEWWYGKFVTSAAYKDIDKSSPFAAPEGISEKKYPRWKRAVAYTKGDLQIVEMPIAYEATRVSLAGLGDIAGTPEADRIAKATLHKLLIFKKPNGNIYVRTVSLVPSREYARSHHYDLSNITFKELPRDFNGYQMVMRWNQKQVSTAVIKSGLLMQKLH